MSHDYQSRHDHDDHNGEAFTGYRPSPGKRTLTARLPGGRIDRAADNNGVSANAGGALQQAASSSGAPLPPDLEANLAMAFCGVDLSAVRVHTGAESDQAARSIGARAYTTGQDIHFARGQYDPTGREGQRLIAHEVAHTVQQRGAAPTTQTKLTVSQPGDSHEREADAAADAFVSGGRARIARSTGLGLHRQRRASSPETCDPDNQPPPRAPERTAVYLTGRYVSQTRNATMQISQAGHHIEGWIQVHGRQATIRHHRFSAQMRENGGGEVTFRGQSRAGNIEAAPDPRSRPSDIVVTGQGGREPGIVEVIVVLRGQTYMLTRSDERTPLSEATISGVGSASATRGRRRGSRGDEEARATLRANEHAPLTPQQQRRIARMPGLIRSHISDFASAGRHARQGTANRLNLRIRSLFGSFDRDQHPLLVRELRARLHGVVHRGTNLWHWMHSVIAQAPGPTADMQQLLDIQPHGDGTQRFHYRWKYDAGGPSADIGVGVMAQGASVVIQQGVLRDDSQPLSGSNFRRTQEWSYTMVRAGVSVGPSAGAAFAETTTWAYFDSPMPWEGRHFVGWIGTAGVNVGGAAGPAQPNLGTSQAVMYGSGEWPALQVPMPGGDNLFGARVGAEHEITIAYLGANPGQALSAARRAAGGRARRGRSRPRISHVGHFATNEHDLNEQGRTAVRAFCATHRALLESRRSSLEIDAYASHLGADCDNQQLTERRAAHTLQFMRNCMGGPGESRRSRMFARVRTRAHGETQATGAAESDNASDRYVHIVLNGSITLRLQG